MSTKVAIVGSGNIGTDLMFKILRGRGVLEVAAMVGIDPKSDGLRRAASMGVPVTSDGVEGLIGLDGFDEIDLIFDATSAKAHVANAALLAPYGKVMIDLTPAAIGPFVAPTVNLREHVGATNVNMVTCGGQATIPIVAAISAVTEVFYAEIVASIASRSAGPGTRANIDEFTETTAEALQTVGGAAKAKAIIVLNPAEPPVIMRDTVACLIGPDHHAEVAASIDAMISRVAQFVPGYRRTQEVQFTPIASDDPIRALGDEAAGTHVVTVLLQVEGAAHYLPAYAGNLDIMTAAAVQVAEELASLTTSRDASTTGTGTS
ncbi:acetaldehyde dehydrogenase (acetylating) [Arthrobacter sp. efr-133-TYG-104]|uniref:acetaldehyde dehydrogenase (acetylating) n=1 Tax=Arthrobacter sp. efr-133-TYG-104 TaxID=3040324 RepID=UPI0025515CDD|nr:acetaldehyde dehydrogenase (acetylating) [Arthrobacter sp. efr-133-TYG-104]